MNILLIYVSIFICVLVASDALLRFARDRFQKQQFVNYRLKLLEKNEDRRAIYERMLKERGLDYSASRTFINNILRYVSQTGMKFSLVRTLTQIAAVFLASFFIADYFIFSKLLAMVVAGFVTVGLTFLFVYRARRRRITKFVQQLPESLDVIVRSLSAGHPLPAAVSLVAREMPDPIGTEFGIMSDEMTYGTDIDVATRNMEMRVGAEELSLLGISLSVQRGSGGNLSEILTNLADMIRRRTMMRAKIRAISAEGRMTSWFMLSFPFFLYSFIYVIRPDYFEPLWESGYGNVFLWSSGTLMVIGMLILRKLVNFDY